MLVDVSLIAVEGILVVGARLLGKLGGNDVTLDAVDAHQEAGEKGDDRRGYDHEGGVLEHRGRW